jgi:prefoldin subunit 5
VSEFDLSKITGTEPPAQTEYDLVEGHLREEIEQLREMLSRFERCYVTVDEALKAKNRDEEIERLRECSAGWIEQHKVDRVHMVAKDKEIERLHRLVELKEEQISHLMEDIKEQDEGLDRLRKLLHEIINVPVGHGQLRVKHYLTLDLEHRVREAIGDE